MIERLCTRELSCFLTTPETKSMLVARRQEGNEGPLVSLDTSLPAGPGWRCWHHRRPDHRKALQLLESSSARRSCLFTVHTTQPANHDSPATNPRLRAACDWSAQRFLREMRPPRSTVRHILDNQAEDDDGGGRHGRPRQNGHNGQTPMASPAAALAVDPGTANLVQ